jgi:uncharacterized membrane protein
MRGQGKKTDGDEMAGKDNEALTIRQRALEAIAALPEDADMDAIMYRLHVLDKIAAGRRDRDKGRVSRADDLKRELAKW